MPFVPFHEKTPDPNMRVWVRIIGLVDNLVLANQDQLKDWQKHFSEVDEWLDESAPITEDMVKDLVFVKQPIKSTVYSEFWVAVAITGTYTVAKWITGECNYDFADGYLDCDDLAHGIALCNQHHKKIILSQLK